MTETREFRWPVRVYYEDTDSGGVVYYANYLKYMERARTEYLRQFGYEQDVLKEELGVLFAVRSVAVDYLRPARFNDALMVTAKLLEHSKASFTFEQKIIKAGEETVLCQGTTKVACLDAARFRPRPIPPQMLAEMLNDH